MKLFYRLLRLLFPGKCVLCRKILEDGELDLCKDCRIQAPQYQNRKNKLQFLDSFAAVWYYEGSVRRSLLRYKFHHARHYAPAYGRLMAMMLLNTYPEGFDLLTWVPVSPLRRLTRGYDQAQLLAKAVGQELGMQPVPLLKKIRHTPPQSGISGLPMRRANVLGVYRLTGKADIRGKRILILDDIITTGSTASECARMLLTAGAGEVHCAAMAAARK